MSNRNWEENIKILLQSLEAETEERRDNLNRPPPGKRAAKYIPRARRELDNLERMLSVLKAAIAEGDMWHAVYAAYLVGRSDAACFLESLDAWQGYDQVQYGRAGNELSHGAKEYDYGYAENPPWGEWRGELAAIRREPGIRTHSAAVREWQQRHPEYGYEFHYLRRKLREN
jgi:hypothetical protein